MPNGDNKNSGFGQRCGIGVSPDRRFAELLKYPTPLQPD